MKKLLFFLAALIFMTACNQDDDTEPSTGQVNFSDLKVGQKSLYQRYFVSNCDMPSINFEWKNDTLILEVTGTESALFLQESLTKYSDDYNENVAPLQYPVSSIDEGVLLTERLGSELFHSLASDTLRLNPVHSGNVTQDGCDSSPSIFSGVALIPNFEVGDVNQVNKSIISVWLGFATGYLIYDNEKVCTRHNAVYNDVPPFDVNAYGWNLIEE